MEVIHVVRQYAPAIGGLESFVKALAEQQVKNGYTVTVITLNRNFSTGDLLNSVENINGVTVKRIAYWGSKRYPFAWGLLQHIDKDALVHVHCTDFLSDYLSFTKFIHGAKLVLSTHGGFFHTNYASFLKRIFFNSVTRLSMLGFARVFACSVGDKAMFESITSKITLIENGVDVDRFLKTSNQKEMTQVQFVFIGRFSSNKSIDKLIDTFSSSLSVHENWKLLIVGNDYDNVIPKLRKQIEECNLEEKIDILTGQTNTEIQTITSRSHFIVSASDYEGFGMTIVEGMAAGMIPIVSDIPSFNRIVDASKLGFVSKYSGDNDAKNIENFVFGCIRNFDEISNEAREYSKNYSWTHVERKFHKEYLRILGKETRIIQGVEIKNVGREEAVTNLINDIESQRFVMMAFANAHTINTAQKSNLYKSTLKNFTVLPDGVGVDIASKMAYGSKFKENLNGTDFVPYCIEKLESKRFYLLGGAEGVAEKAMDVWKAKYPKHTWVGSHNGFLSDSESEDLSKLIHSLEIDILIVAMGNPLQELWIDKYAEACGVQCAIGVGALLDFTSGEAKRAPLWLRRYRLEWVYRLLKEPRRLFKRYIVGNALFLLNQVTQGAKV